MTMRVTIVLPIIGHSGGIRVAAVYADRLARLGHDVTLVAPAPGARGLKGRASGWARGYGWLKRWPSAWNYVENLACKVHVLDRRRPVDAADVPDADVVVATWWETAEWAWFYPPGKGAKAYFIQGYEVWDPLPVERVRSTWRLPMQKIVVAQWLADIARDEFDDPSAIVVPNGVDTGSFSAPPRDKGRVPTVGYVHNALPIKGCDLLARAVELARERVPALRVRVFGANPPGEDVPLPAGSEFTLQPSHEQMVEIYAGCDAWLFGSRQEGFGLPLLEAMACRTPVIATPGGAAPDLVPEGGGIVVPHGDPRAFADAIATMVGEENSAWRARSDRARAQAEACTWEHSARRFERALARAVERRGHDAA